MAMHTVVGSPGRSLEESGVATLDGGPDVGSPRTRGRFGPHAPGQLRGCRQQDLSWPSGRAAKEKVKAGAGEQEWAKAKWVKDKDKDIMEKGKGTEKGKGKGIIGYSWGCCKKGHRQA